MAGGRLREVVRHGGPFRILHWAIFAEGALLALTGLQLGGIIVVLPAQIYAVHVITGIAFCLTAPLFVLEMVESGDYRWVSLRRIPYSIRFIIAETRAWFSIGPKTKNPIAVSAENGQYVEKLVPSVIIVFWAFLLLGAALGLSGLALAYPAQFSFLYAILNPIGSLLTGVTGLAFMLVFHRLMTFILVALVAAHVYASFVFKLVTSMITGRKAEKVAVPQGGAAAA
jgi:formate dehydrogenase subunit gamma